MYTISSQRVFLYDEYLRRLYIYITYNIYNIILLEQILVRLLNNVLKVLKKHYKHCYLF
jgi:hypothetical protein